MQFQYTRIVFFSYFVRGTQNWLNSKGEHPNLAKHYSFVWCETKW